MNSFNKAFRCWILVFVLSLSAFVACEERLGTVEIQVNALRLTVEVARTEEERAQGLMFRKHLAADGGMLFVYDRDRRLSFWMQNTEIPLSIAFIAADGEIKEIRDMEPFSERTILSRQSVRYALEMNRGAFSRLGIKPGDTVVLPD